MNLRNGRTLAAVAGALVGVAVSLHPSSAGAACAEPSSCICSYSNIASALIVTVSSVGEAQIEASVSTVFTRPGETSSFTEGDPVTLEAGRVPDGPPAVGEGLLVTVAVLDSGETNIDVISRIAADGRITCRFATDYRPTAARAAQLALSDTCTSDVNGEIGPIECNDTGPFGCSMPGGGPGGPGAVGAALGLLGLAVGAARRRRRAC